CKRGPEHSYEAMECLGGNGYTEDFPLAMRYREQPVMAIWEGSGNVIALDVLRALGREPDATEAFLAEVGRASGAHPAFDAHLTRTTGLLRELAQDADAAPAHARRLTEWLALALQASLLLRHAPTAVGEGFAAARLGGDGGRLYGALPAGVDAKAIVSRA